MVTTVGGVQIEIRGDPSSFQRSMREVQRDASKTGQSVTREFTKADQSVTKLNNSLRTSSSVFAGLVSVASGGILAGAVIQAADAFSGMRSKIALAISAADDLLTVERQIYAQAIANRSALEPIVALYQRIRGARSDLSNEQTLEITDRFSKSLVISGASAAGAASATLQFSQAIAGGVLRAEEFNSIIESNVRFVKLLADNLGVSVGQIRNLVNEGAITSDVIFRAIRENGADLDAEFTKIPLTVSSALVNVRNAFTNFIGLSDQAGGTSAKLAGFINSIADDFDRLAEVVVAAAATIGGGVAGLLAARFVSGLLAIAAASGTATGAVGALRAQLAFFGGPVGLAITAVGAAFAFLSITAEDSLDKISRATGEYDSAVKDLLGTQEELKGQYAALEALNRDLAKAIEDGAAAAEVTASREIDALQLRIDKNRELLAVYEEQAAAALDDARAGRDTARNDFAQSLGLPRRFDYNTNPEARAELDRAGAEFRASLAAQRANGRALDENTRKARDYFIAWQEAEQQVSALSRRQGERIVAAGIAAFGIPEAVAESTAVQTTAVAALADETDRLTEAQLDLLDVLDDADGVFQNRRDASTLQRVDEFRLNKAEAEANANAISDRVAATISGALEQGIRSGNWGEAFRSILAESTSTALSQAINELADELVSLFSGLFDGAGPSIGTALGSIFGGGRAAGGPVKAGMRYMVGEQGPEMFVPTVSGVILPRAEFPASSAAGGLSGGHVVTVAPQFHVHGSITEDVLPRVQQMFAQQARELPRAVLAVVKDGQRRGRF